MITRTTNNKMENPTTTLTGTMKEVVAFLKAINTKREETNSLHTTRTTNPTILNQQNSENHGT